MYRLPDAALEDLILYFKEKRADMDMLAKPTQELDHPAGEKYFLLPVNALP